MKSNYKRIITLTILLIAFAFTVVTVSSQASAKGRQATPAVNPDKCPPIFDCPPGWRKQDGMCVEC